MVGVEDSNDASKSRLLAVRGLLTPAAHTLFRLLERLPGPAQRLGASALRTLAARWPLLARLLGRTVPAPRAAERPAPVPAQVLDAAILGHLGRLAEARDYADRARAAQALGDVIHPDTTAGLVAALRDRSAEVASQAADSLARHGGAVAIAALREVVENREAFFSAGARAAAVRALGTLLPAGEGTPLTTAVADVDALVSLAAIAALAERDETTSCGALMSLLEDRRGYYLPLTRLAAARALLRLHSYDRYCLRGLLETEADTTVREALSTLAN